MAEGRDGARGEEHSVVGAQWGRGGMIAAGEEARMAMTGAFAVEGAARFPEKLLQGKGRPEATGSDHENKAAVEKKSRLELGSAGGKSGGWATAAGVA